MSTARHLPSGAEATANNQGWNDESIVVHLAGFISQQGLNDKLTDYLAVAAAEENADLGTDEDDIDQDEIDEDAERE